MLVIYQPPVVDNSGVVDEIVHQCSQQTPPAAASSMHCSAPSMHCGRCSRRDWCVGQQLMAPLCDRCRQMRDLVVGHMHCTDASHMHGLSPCCYHQCDACSTMLASRPAFRQQMSSNYVHQSPASINQSISEHSDWLYS